jgi:hypothetical protein
VLLILFLRRNSGGVGQLPYCGGRITSRIHDVWLLSLLVSGTSPGRT